MFRTGRFNVVRGLIGTVVAIGASVRTAATGFIFQGLGHWDDGRSRHPRHSGSDFDDGQCELWSRRLNLVAN
jgi:hypothetical protein